MESAKGTVAILIELGIIKHFFSYCFLLGKVLAVDTFNLQRMTEVSCRNNSLLRAYCYKDYSVLDVR